jgi:pyruvate,water dikinase
MMEDVAWFKELSKDDIPLVGGKGANLGEMYNIGLPIPPGFAITSEAFRKFIVDKKIDQQIFEILQKTNVDENEQLEDASAQIKNIILTTEMQEDLKTEIKEAYDNLNVSEEVIKFGGQPLDIIKSGREQAFVAVRSSATAEDLPQASFAGQQESFLNIRGTANLIKAVQKCWASLYTPRAIYYRVKNNFPHDKVLICVIVQKMVRSEKSGVMFSVNPATNDEDEIMIESGWGLGEAVVLGAISPDQYIVDKKTLQIKNVIIREQTWMYDLDTNIGQTVKKNVSEEKQNKQKLSEAEIRKLAEYALKIEQHYGKAQDMEYALENNKIYIVQSRPVTTLKKPHKDEVEETETEVLVTGLGASPGVGVGPVRIISGMEELGKIKKGDVLVTRMTNPDMVPAMERAVAIVTDAGGTTCHAAIVSREMGIPCIVGTEKATQILKEDETVSVDGSRGKVFKGRIKVQEKKEGGTGWERVEAGEFMGPVETVTEIKVIMDLPQFAEKAAATGADGVGLLRNNLMLAKHGEHPSYMVKHGKKDQLVETIVNDVSKIAEAFDGKPVWYRTFDAPTDEYRHMKGGEDEPVEQNPMMGWRSIRRGLDEVDILKAEFEAIKKIHDKGLKNVGIMLPLVISVEEIKKSKEILREFGLEPQKDIEFGVMIETPASVQIIEEICKEGIDFISFGTNDLTQFTLAIDRDNAKVAKLYSEKHPAVLRQIKYVIDTCKKYDVLTSICGQAGSDPEMAEILVKMGIDSITANVDAVHKIRNIVARIEKKLILSSARKEFNI